MKFMVTWGQRALQHLADIWNNAGDRAEVTRASGEINRILESDPLGVGESRTGMLRILINQPLAVYYSVDQARRSVLVLSVWRV